MVRNCTWCGRESLADRHAFYSKDIYYTTKTEFYLCSDCYKQLQDYSHEQILKHQKEHTERWQNEISRKMQTRRNRGQQETTHPVTAVGQQEK